MVQTEFDRGRAQGGGWGWILTLYDETKPFLERYEGATGPNVIAYYVTDPEHAGSIQQSVSAARDNARALRALISTDFWIQVNKLHQHMRALDELDVDERRLTQTCETIQTECYALLGIAESTFYRDSGWRLFRLGLEIERADQMSRLLDVRFAQLQSGTADRGEEFGDFAFWSLLLRACGGQHAFRRLISGPLRPESVARFLIFDHSFARSLGHCQMQIDATVGDLRTRCGLETPAPLLTSVNELSEMIHVAATDPGLITHLHTFNDALQQQLSRITSALSDAYFASRPPQGAPPEDLTTPVPSAAQVQSPSTGSGQSQSQQSIS